VVGRATRQEVVALARALRDADLPAIRLPDGTPPAPPTVPPVRLGVHAGADRIFVEAPASHLDHVPVLGHLLRRVHDMAERAAAEVETEAPVADAATAARALEELAAGRSAPVIVRATFRPSAERRSELVVASTGDVVRREQVDDEPWTTEPLGRVAPVEIARLARSLLDGGVLKAPLPAEGEEPLEHPRAGLTIDAAAVELTIEIAHARRGEVPGLDSSLDAIYALARAARASEH
jgi:hypothetical protein